MNNSSLDILINVPLKYPELNAIKYQADEQTIALKFALLGIPVATNLQEFQDKLHKVFKIFHELGGGSPKIFKISLERIEEVIFISLYRDEESLSEEEIDLYITFLKGDFDDYLVKDRIDIIKNDSYKKRLKKNLLHKINQAQNCNSFWAFRQGGQVFVLNK